MITEEIPTRELALKALTFCVRKRMDPRIMWSVKPDVILDQVSSDMIMSLESRIWGRELGVDHLKWPATWWDAVRERWCPAWALKRWPVRYRRYSVQAWHTYPTLAIRSEHPRLHMVVTPE